MRIETIKVQPWGKVQGDYIEINADDFDPAKHKKWPAETAAPKPRAKKGAQ